MPSAPLPARSLPAPSTAAAPILRPPAAARARDDGGQVTPLVAVALVVGAVAALLVASLGEVVNDRARARTAADAAALAGAAGGREVAGAIARANAGDVEAYAVEGAEVEVTVRVGRARATSRAARRLVVRRSKDLVGPAQPRPTETPAMFGRRSTGPVRPRAG